MDTILCQIDVTGKVYVARDGQFVEVGKIEPSQIYRLLNPSRNFAEPIWELIDPRFQWWSVDDDGYVCLYVNEPVFGGCVGVWAPIDNGWAFADQPVLVLPDNNPEFWKTTLRRRPEVTK